VVSDLDDQHLYPSTGGSRGPDVVIEATGNPAVIPLAFKACRASGRVVLLGSTRGFTENVDFYDDVHRKNLTIIGAHESGHPVHESRPGSWTVWDDRALALQLITAGKLPGQLLISHEFAAEQVADAYRTVIDDPRALAVLLRW
jgi:L-iditol 2-dehydrogenase